MATTKISTDNDADILRLSPEILLSFDPQCPAELRPIGINSLPPTNLKRVTAVFHVLLRARTSSAQPYSQVRLPKSRTIVLADAKNSPEAKKHRFYH